MILFKKKEEKPPAPILNAPVINATNEELPEFPESSKEPEAPEPPETSGYTGKDFISAHQSEINAHFANLMMAILAELTKLNEQIKEK